MLRVAGNEAVVVAASLSFPRWASQSRVLAALLWPPWASTLIAFQCWWRRKIAITVWQALAGPLVSWPLGDRWLFLRSWFLNLVWNHGPCLLLLLLPPMFIVYTAARVNSKTFILQTWFWNSFSCRKLQKWYQNFLHPLRLDSLNISILPIFELSLSLSPHT